MDGDAVEGCTLQAGGSLYYNSQAGISCGDTAHPLVKCVCSSATPLPSGAGNDLLSLADITLLEYACVDIAPISSVLSLVTANALRLAGRRLAVLDVDALRGAMVKLLPGAVLPSHVDILDLGDQCRVCVAGGTDYVADDILDTMLEANFPGLVAHELGIGGVDFSTPPSATVITIHAGAENPDDDAITDVVVWANTPTILQIAGSHQVYEYDYIYWTRHSEAECTSAPVHGDLSGYLDSSLRTVVNVDPGIYFLCLRQGRWVTKHARIRLIAQHMPPSPPPPPAPAAGPAAPPSPPETTPLPPDQPWEPVPASLLQNAQAEELAVLSLSRETGASSLGLPDSDEANDFDSEGVNYLAEMPVPDSVDGRTLSEATGPRPPEPPVPDSVDGRTLSEVYSLQGGSLDAPADPDDHGPADVPVQPRLPPTPSGKEPVLEADTELSPSDEDSKHDRAEQDAEPVEEGPGLTAESSLAPGTPLATTATQDVLYYEGHKAVLEELAWHSGVLEEAPPSSSPLPPIDVPSPLPDPVAHESEVLSANAPSPATLPSPAPLHHEGAFFPDSLKEEDWAGTPSAAGATTKEALFLDLGPSDDTLSGRELLEAELLIAALPPVDPAAALGAAFAAAPGAGRQGGAWEAEDAEDDANIPDEDLEFAVVQQRERRLQTAEQYERTPDLDDHWAPGNSAKRERSMRVRAAQGPLWSMRGLRSPDERV